VRIGPKGSHSCSIALSSKMRASLFTLCIFPLATLRGEAAEVDRQPCWNPVSRRCLTRFRRLALPLRISMGFRTGLFCRDRAVNDTLIVRLSRNTRVVPLFFCGHAWRGSVGVRQKTGIGAGVRAGRGWKADCADCPIPV
jgi:hypothetical protein